jgi:hypothetical protein
MAKGSAAPAPNGLGLRFFVIFAGAVVHNRWKMFPKFHFQFFQGI